MRSSSTPRRRDATTTRRATTTTRRRRDDRSDRSRVSRCRARGVERASSIDRFDARATRRPTERDRRRDRHRWRVRPTSKSKSTPRTAIDRCDRTSTRRSNDRRIARSTLGSPSAPTSRPAAQRDGRRHERLGRRQRRFTTPERGTAAATDDDDDDDDDDTETVDVGAGAAGRVAAEIGIRPAASAESARGGGRRRVARIRCVDDDGATRANDGDGDDERDF